MQRLNGQQNCDANLLFLSKMTNNDVFLISLYFNMKKNVREIYVCILNNYCIHKGISDHIARIVIVSYFYQRPIKGNIHDQTISVMSDIKESTKFQSS